MMDLRKFVSEYAFGLSLNANDIFSYATAEACEVIEEDIDRLLEIEARWGWQGILAYMASVKKRKPLHTGPGYEGAVAAVERMKEVDPLFAKGH